MVLICPDFRLCTGHDENIKVGGTKMKRRSITRFLAMLLVVCMLGCDGAVYATEVNPGENIGAGVDDGAVTDDETDVTDKNEDDATTDEDAEDKEDADSKEDEKEETYINDRLETNYTNVSSKYKLDKYKGDTIVIDILDAYVSTVNGKGETVDTLTTETNNYEGSDKVVELVMGDIATFEFNVEKDGVYMFAMDQLAFDETSILSVEMTLKLNGQVPFYECNRLVFESKWEGFGGEATDRFDNEIVSVPDKLLEWQRRYIKDASYRYTTALAFELKAGKNVITMQITEGSVRIGDFYLVGEKDIPAYETGHTADGDFYQAIRAERPAYKNDSSIRATCEYDCDLDPYSSTKKLLNIIDSASFADSGLSMTYEVTVEKDGYYYFGFNYRQTDKVDFPVFMNIYVDGEFPNELLQSYGFDYTKGFEKTTLKGSDGKKMAIYLTAGTHEVTLELANDNVREALETFDRIMSEINDLSLEITKVAGTNTSQYRDIDILSYIPDIEERLNNWTVQLQETYKELEKYATAENCGTISYLVTAVDRLKDLAKKPNKIPYRRGELATDTSSVNQDIANTISELSANNISFDTFYVYQEESADQIPGKTNIFVKIWESIKRFFASFGAQAYTTADMDVTHLQVWINRPRQYLEIIQQLVDETFTPVTGIKVDLAIMPDAQKLILANAAGESPDVAQAIDYTQPFELAIRNALVDLTKFDDYAEVMSWFPEGLLVPSTIGESIYSLPETFYFWVLFYRTDILEKLNIEVPKTIDDVQKIIPELKNRGLEFFYPTAGTTGQRSLAMTTPLLYQYGTSLYYGSTDIETTKPYYATSINSENGIAGFETLTELFTIYDIPQECSSFYQHFRNGDFPIGISDYFMYSLLINAAPEIENSWNISIIPGIETVQEDGTVVSQNMTAGAAQNSVIMKSGYDELIVLENGSTMARDEAAWEYLKWWMCTETQVSFGNILQTTYGKEYIWNSANTEAFAELPWKSRDKAIILEQMENIVESPRIPGTYMLERELSNAYIEVVINGGTLRTALDSAVKRIDRETKRKLQEFGYLDASGNIIKEYEIPSVETVREIIAKGLKE